MLLVKTWHQRYGNGTT